jgi:exodeoxyribonuclease VII large subunit
VTSLGAAALHDVVTALRRRAPHVPVVIYPASVQGAAAAGELRQALQTSWQRAEVDILLLVRGGGAMEDLWAFNDEPLARAIAASPIPVVCGVGHETDFTIADFCADLRAPTPTAAAEMCAQPRSAWLGALDLLEGQLRDGVQRKLEAGNQRLDWAASRVSRPSHLVTRQQARLASQAQRLRHALRSGLQQEKTRFHAVSLVVPQAWQRTLAQHERRLERAQLRLAPLDPALVLQRGYAWLTDMQGHAITRASATQPGQALRATLADGEVDLTVAAPRLI